MRLMFVHWLRADAGSAQDIQNYVRVAEGLGHEIVVYGASDGSPFNCSTEISYSDALVFTFETSLGREYRDNLDLALLVARVPREQYGMSYVGHNWRRWDALHQVLKALEPVRRDIGSIVLVGSGWDSSESDPEYLRRLGVEVRPSVQFDRVIESMGLGVFVRSCSARTGPSRSSTSFGVLHDAEIVHEMRQDLAERHAYRARVQELVDICEGAPVTSDPKSAR